MKFFATNINTTSHPIQGFGNDSIGVTENYLTHNGKPWLPVMGELHYSRVAEKDWDKELEKMKKGGIMIVSSYVFWIHHEECEGTYDWSGNRNLRKFILLCEKHGLYFFLRPGPWAHGECRNGGFPDWLLEKCGKDTRCNKEPYLSYVKRFFGEVSKQVNGLSNIIGIQAENEKIDDPDYLLEVKKLIIDVGMNAPIFTATAWGYLPQTPINALLPVYGGYPEAPWEQHTKALPPNSHYFFSYERNDNVIGNDLMTIKESVEERAKNPINTPFITCELGGGNQATYHRRPVIKSADVAAMTITTLGSGCNLLGYYMYHGGSNPIGELSTMQESKFSGYINDYPIISYDFYSPIGECGQIRDSYFELAALHSFVKSYGELLAPMPSVLPCENDRPRDKFDNKSLRCSIRTDGKSGFLFVNNYQRLVTLPQHPQTNISIELESETLQILDLNVPQNSRFIIPFNLNIGGKLLKYALAQPFSIEENVWSFLEIDGVSPHFYFEDFDFVLTDKEYKMGDITLKLFKQPTFPKTMGKKLEVTKTKNSIPFENFKYLCLTDHTSEYSIDLANTDDDFLKLECMGNVMQAYCGQKLIADYFCDGMPIIIDVREFKNKEIILKIQPLLGDEDIYFEAEMSCEDITPIVTAIKGDELYI